MDEIAKLDTAERKEIRGLITGGGAIPQLIKEVVERGQRFGRYVKSKSTKAVWNRLDRRGDRTSLKNHLQGAAELLHSKGYLLDKGGVTAPVAEVYLSREKPPEQVGDGPIMVSWSWEERLSDVKGLHHPRPQPSTTIIGHRYQARLIPGDRLKAVVRWAETVDRICCDHPPGDRGRAFEGLFACQRPFPRPVWERLDGEDFSLISATIHVHQTVEHLEVGLAVGVTPTWTRHSFYTGYGGPGTAIPYVDVDPKTCRLPSYYVRPSQALADWHTWVKLGTIISTVG